MTVQRFHDVPSAQKWVLAGVIGGVLLAAFAVGVIDPIREKIRGLRAEIVQLDQRLTAAMKKMGEQDRLNAELAKIQAKVRAHMRQISVSSDVGSLRREVSTIAGRFGITVTRWSPDLESSTSWNRLKQVPITMQLLGRYHQTMLFLETVLRDFGVHRVESLTMQVAGDGSDSRTLQTDVRLVGMIAKAPGSIAAQAAHRTGSPPALSTGS